MEAFKAAEKRVMIDLHELRNTDIYLLDQILKGRYDDGLKILDAGVGSGRNLNWFLAWNKMIHALDVNPDSKMQIAERYPDQEFIFVESGLSETPFESNYFDHVLCNAVLHFAHSETHFIKMIGELHRIVKAEGTLFIRTCTSIGIEDQIEERGEGVFELPDGSNRFLMTRTHLNNLLESGGFNLLEPVKWLNVHDQRVMMTLVLEKTSNEKISALL